VISEP